MSASNGRYVTIDEFTGYIENARIMMQAIPVDDILTGQKKPFLAKNGSTTNQLGKERFLYVGHIPTYPQINWLTNGLEKTCTDA